MKANYTIEAGDVRVIRPLVYVREKSTRDFSQEAHLPVINENCPACFEEPKVRMAGQDRTGQDGSWMKIDSQNAANCVLVQNPPHLAIDIFQFYLTYLT